MDRVFDPVKLAEATQKEELILYPHVEEHLKGSGIAYYAAYRPDNILLVKVMAKAALWFYQPLKSEELSRFCMRLLALQ